ncbi:MAG: hypothetical protein WCE54_02410 [Ignavibacteriaceae bacterium]
MGFFEILGIVFLGILALNGAIGIWALKTAKSDESVEYSNSVEHLHGLKVSKI